MWFDLHGSEIRNINRTEGAPLRGAGQRGHLSEVRKRGAAFEGGAEGGAKGGALGRGIGGVKDYFSADFDFVGFEECEVLSFIGFAGVMCALVAYVLHDNAHVSAVIGECAVTSLPLKYFGC